MGFNAAGSKIGRWWRFQAAEQAWPTPTSVTRFCLCSPSRGSACAHSQANSPNDARVTKEQLKERQSLAKIECLLEQNTQLAKVAMESRARCVCFAYVCARACVDWSLHTTNLPVGLDTIRGPPSGRASRTVRLLYHRKAPSQPMHFLRSIFYRCSWPDEIRQASSAVLCLLCLFVLRQSCVCARARALTFPLMAADMHRVEHCGALQPIA